MKLEIIIEKQVLTDITLKIEMVIHFENFFSYK